MEILIHGLLATVTTLLGLCVVNLQYRISKLEKDNK